MDPNTEQILRSALNAAEQRALIFESAMNSARSDNLVLRGQVDDLIKRPTQDSFDTLRKQFESTKENDAKLQQETQQQLAACVQQQLSDQQAGDGFLRRLGQLIKKYLPLSYPQLPTATHFVIF